VIAVPSRHLPISGHTAAGSPTRIHSFVVRGRWLVLSEYLYERLPGWLALLNHWCLERKQP
jgi:hypothetical protein